MLPRAYVPEVSFDHNESGYIDFIDLVDNELRRPLLEDNEAVRNLGTTVSTTTFPPSKSSAQVPNPATLTSLKNFKDDSQALKIIAHAASNLFQTTTLAAKVKDIPQEYHQWEPVKAVCDSVGYIRIPGVFSSITASESFNVIHPPAMKSRSKSKLNEASNHPAPTGSEDIQGTTTSRLLPPKMGRPADPKNPEDLHAGSQNYSFSLEAAGGLPKATSTPSPPAGGAPVSEEKVTPVEVEHYTKHNLKDRLVQTRGKPLKQTSVTKTIDIRKGWNNPCHCIIEALKMFVDLFLPIISAEHKKATNALFLTGVNQGRMYATAAVKFYAALGIYGLGVYTVISEGSILVVTVAYGEKLKENPLLPNLPPHKLVHKDNHAPDPTKLQVGVLLYYRRC